MDILTDGPLVVLDGAFDARSTREVRQVVYDQLALHPTVTIDLSRVPAVDLVALRVLALATHRAARHGQVLTLRGCNGGVLRLLHASHLIRVVDVERPRPRAGV